ncbi:hypothetical protein ACIQU6_30705 [Streptomyces sp. NPDC090442]|uniref:hypothetical protein n=1 Tax=Streptomyces sp. NPDC090442 TaxID=3365962 RepID=UPI0037FEDC41
MPCPRCTGPINGPGATSRITTPRTIRICTMCGTEEAMRDATGRAPIPHGEWPLTRH